MIEVTRALSEDVPEFAAMEQSPDTKEYILPYTQSEHLQKFLDANFVYLRILKQGELAGFFILALDPDGKSIEFRRIVVSAKGHGIGQSAIAAMENLCRTELGRPRIWLDVLEHNHRGRHIYEKLGYENMEKAITAVDVCCCIRSSSRQFGTRYTDGRAWLININQ